MGISISIDFAGLRENLMRLIHGLFIPEKEKETMKIINDGEEFCYLATIESTLDDGIPPRTIVIIGDFENGILDATKLLNDWMVNINGLRHELIAEDHGVDFIRDIREVRGIVLIDESAQYGAQPTGGTPATSG